MNNIIHCLLFFFFLVTVSLSYPEYWPYRELGKVFYVDCCRHNFFFFFGFVKVCMCMSYHICVMLNGHFP